MAKPKEQEPEEGKEPQFDWNEFWKNPEVRQQIPRLVDLWNKHFDIKERTAIRASKRFLIISITLFVAIVISVIWLTLADRISTEATAFLLGVIITGTISIIRDFTSSGR